MLLTAIAFLITLHISGIGGIPSKYDRDRSTSNPYLPRCFQFKCSNGICSLDKIICKNVTNCVEGSDKMSCPCKPNEFECKDKSCIDSMNTCDGKYDCPDKSDENYEMCNSIPCPRSFRCNSGGCIPKVKYCNKVQDCEDGSDELYNKTSCPFGIRNTCTVPEKPDNGYFIHYTTMQKVSYGDTVNKHEYIELKCFNNTDCEGPTHSKCSHNSTWDFILSCKKRCRFTPSTTVVAECMDQSKESFPCENSKYLKHNTIVVYKCKSKHFFELHQDSKTTTCNNGIWDISSVVCKEDCGLESGYSQSNITKKQLAEPGTFPWHVAIYLVKEDEYYEYFEYACGGSIVKSNIVISAAHCVWDPWNSKPYDTQHFQVVAGKRFRTRNIDIDIQEAWVRKISVPPQYNGAKNFWSYDIAILQISKMFTFTQYVSPICLDFNEEFNNKQLETLNKGKVAGWGVFENGTFSDYLLYSFLPVVDYDTCEPTIRNESKIFFTIDKFCAGYKNSVFLCEGDNGEGLVFNLTANNVTRWYIRGILSRTNRFLSNGICKISYAHFTKILTHKDFIIDNLGN